MPSEDQLRSLELHQQRQLVVPTGSMVFLLYALTLWLIGAMAGYGIDFKAWGYNIYTFGSEPMVPLFLLTVLAFLASAMFFGKLAPLVFLYLGIVSGNAMNSQFLLGALSFIPFAISSHAGMAAGYALYDDFHGKDNFFGHWKEWIAPLAIALGLGVLLSFAAGGLKEWNEALTKALQSFKRALQ